LEALTEAGYSNPKQTMKDLEAFTKEIKKLLEEDTKAIINEIYDYDSVQDFIVQRWPELKNSKDLVEKLTTTVSMKLGEVIPKYVADYISRTDPALSYIGLTHKTTAWITSWSGKLAEMMKLTDNKTIERILNDALKNGRSVAETAKRIGDSGERDSGYRSRRTATTELLRAHSVAQQESFMQSPAVVSKMWRHSGWRQYSRQNHIDMDGQTVRKEDPFILAGEEGIFYPMYPRDENLPAGESINCGCVAEPIVDERFYEMSEEDRRRMQEAEINRINEEYDRKTGLYDKVNNSFVTGEYRYKMKPGTGKVTREKGFIEKDHENEIKGAKWLNKTFGGDVIIRAESKEDNQVSADYEWRGKLWDLKCPSSSAYGTIEKRIRHGLIQIEDNPGGLLLDFTDSKLDISSAKNMTNEILEKRAKRGLDVIVKKDDLFEVIRITK